MLSCDPCKQLQNSGHSIFKDLWGTGMGGAGVAQSPISNGKTDFNSLSSYQNLIFN